MKMTDVFYAVVNFGPKEEGKRSAPLEEIKYFDNFGEALISATEKYTDSIYDIAIMRLSPAALPELLVSFIQEPLEGKYARTRDSKFQGGKPMAKIHKRFCEDGKKL